MEDKKMKFTKTLASVAAASLAVSSLAVSAFAADALVSMTVSENGAPKDAGQVHLWELPFDDTVATWAGNVDKAVATVTSQAYANGGLGANTVAADGWAASAQQENSAAGTNEWVWDSIGGLKAGKDDEGNETGYFKVEVWWMNAQGEEGNQTPATLTIDKVDFYDKAGDLLATYPVADETPADTDTKPADTVTEKMVKVEAKKATQNFDNGLRVNFVHPWAGDRMEEFNIVNKADFEGTQKITVKFNVSEFKSDFAAYLCIATNLDDKVYPDSNVSFWGKPEDAVGVTETPLTITKDGDYELTLETAVPLVIGDNFFFDLQTDIQGKDEEMDKAPVITITSIEKAVKVADSNGDKTPDDDTKNDDTKNDDTNKEDPVKPGECTGVVPGECSGKKPEEPPVVGPTEDPTEPGKSDTKPANDNKKPANPNAGVTVAVVPAAVAAAAVAAAGIVLKKRSK